MKHLILKISLVHSLVLASSCSELKLTSTAESERLEFFFPVSEFKDSLNPNGDTAAVIYYSRLFNSFEEPSLYEQSVEISSIRILSSASFAPTICIRVEKKADRLILFAKEVDLKNEFTANHNYVISIKQWAKLEELIDSEEFWKLPSINNPVPQGDGSTWLLEAMLEGKYHLIRLQNPKPTDPGYQLGNYLISLADSNKNK